MRKSFDILVVGAGIAGASFAASLPERQSVALLEQEDHPGFHATGRSAALFSKVYGNEVIRALSGASERVLRTPPAELSSQSFLKPRGNVFIARADQLDALDKLARQPGVIAHCRKLDGHEVTGRCPILKPEYAAAGLFEPEAADIDVHALHSGYLRLFRARGGSVVTRSVVTKLGFANGSWLVDTSSGQFSAPILVNAAGAWADAIAALAGIPPLGIEPRRRTVILVDKPANIDIDNFPFIVDVDEQFYFKPETGFILASAADETPSIACDAQPEELEIATAADRLERATIVQVKRIYRSWAGLRTFSADRTPVVGYQPGGSSFFWLVGQGGYGIQTAPALARLSVALLHDRPIPADIIDFGLSPAALKADRFSQHNKLSFSI